MAEAIDLNVGATQGLRPVQGLRLQGLVGSERAARLAEYHAYYRCRQYQNRAFNWDGMRDGYGQTADIDPGYYVPISQRRPSTRVDFGRQVVKRFTSLTLGHGRWPQINIDGDEDAQDYVRELAKQARLQTKMVEARNLGGACGSVGLSFAFIEGRPRVAVHKSQNLFPLEWGDRDELRLNAVLECYAYTRLVYEPGKSDAKRKRWYYARLWTTETETVWDPIPAELAEDGTWAARVPRQTVRHGFGFCPVYWVQNTPTSEEEDGESDFEGLPDIIDAMSQLASQTTKGTTANCDPTLVVRDEPSENGGQRIRKGSGNAIWSKGGAEYLTLGEGAVRAAREWLDRLHRESQESAQVVFPDPEKLVGKLQSAAALRMLYLPMLSQCDVLRDQYGTVMVALLRGMLDVARRFQGEAGTGGPILATVDGRRIQESPVVDLPMRVDDEGTQYPRNPGSSSEIELAWPPYFPDTWSDIQAAVEAASKATGGKAVLSQETAVKTIAPKFGAFDTTKELDRLEMDHQKSMELMNGTMFDEDLPPGPKKPDVQQEDGEGDEA